MRRRRKPREHTLTDRQLKILEFIEEQTIDKGFPPSVREIGEEVGLTSPSTVHNHLEKLEKFGYIEKDPSTPRGIRICWDPTSGAADVERRPAKHVALIGEVAAGTGVLAKENVEEMLPLPIDLVGEKDLFMLKVRGDSMIELGIFDGDYVVAESQNTADNGDIVIAGIPGDEATIKTFRKEDNKIKLIPANQTLEPMLFEPDEVQIYGKAITIIRQL